MTIKEKEEILIRNGYDSRGIMIALNNEEVCSRYKKNHIENQDYVYVQPDDKNIEDFIEKSYRILEKVLI